MMHQPLLLLPLLLAAYTVVGVSSSPDPGKFGIRSQPVVEWPGTGLSLCQQLQGPHYRNNCLQCFTTAGQTLSKVKECVKTLLPNVIAKCATFNSIKTFNTCVGLQMLHLNMYNNRAELLYKKGGAVLKKVTDSKILKDGPAAVFSCIAQKLLINTDLIKNALNVEENTCFKRFQVDSANEKWHLHHSRGPKLSTNNHTKTQAFQKSRTTESQHEGNNIVYEYGVMGHRMPFHGIGPLAVEILKGVCLMHYLEDNGKLQAFVDSSLSSLHPMPAWLFQESLNKISSITLPKRAPSA